MSFEKGSIRKKHARRLVRMIKYELTDVKTHVLRDSWMHEMVSEEEMPNCKSFSPGKVLINRI